eukprot:m.74891 g.74891  ORF g.74891 m.74891 type:complete len:184 (-) comp12484_c0_seq1:195-746(-)
MSPSPPRTNSPRPGRLRRSQSSSRLQQFISPSPPPQRYSLSPSPIESPPQKTHSPPRQSNRVTCPICTKEFPRSKIEKHAATCNGVDGCDDDEQAGPAEPTPRRSSRQRTPEIFRQSKRKRIPQKEKNDTFIATNDNDDIEDYDSHEYGIDDDDEAGGERTKIILFVCVCVCNKVVVFRFHSS